MYKVLIVDDEDIIREGLVEYIDWHSLGFEVIGNADNGETALEIAKGNCLDVLITDIRMPFMDGLELSKQLRQVFPDIKILILSGHDEFNYAQEAILSGVSEYILKPINSKELILIIKRIKEELDETKKSNNNIIKIKQQLMESIPLLRERFFQGVIYGIFDPEEVKSKQGFLDIDLGETPYTVALFSIDDFTNSKMEQEEKEILRYSLYDTVKNFLVDDVKKIVFNDKYENVVCIFSGVGKQQIINICEEIKDNYYEEYLRTITIGIGISVDNIPSIKKSYKNSREALDNRFVFGKNMIIHIEDINPVGNIEYINDSEVQNRIIKSIKLNNNEQIEQAIDDYFKKITEAPIALDYIKLVLIELVSALRTFIYEVGIANNEEMITTHNYYKKLDEFETISDIQIWLKQICLKISEKISNKRNNQYSKIVLNVKEYINEHYMDENISLKTVANEFYISHCYLSTIFKKETGESFIEYLTNMRIEKAKALIRDTSLKLYEIASRTGFSDQYYFSQIFKKYVGVSPIDYKESLNSVSQRK